ncbi:HAD superfamily protein, putative [Plasmodium berghei]|uniref:phosphatidate phosphatase n=2 Tax=Plasmodium berghei TaxID=5821 RepID=A0A509AHH5_PLABA|nr:HAD superfamily protein, putative [Plasmodium berghei ANKA]CXH99104.1 HAD superfamily protein, putative [Plasmodium berghei]VUC54242.1 HAD superfamily protein, putative [Plasmodium berghei ANKA]|eukprot:XP_034420075.1 HAD superfamily protein, putative [Plasmodium berghei ANKA]
MWGKIVSSVSNALDFNQATLSGCIDIICIESEIESEIKNDKKISLIYKSTPFHVRFGKTKLLRSKEKIVNILVNGKTTNLHMKLGSAGEAYFVEKTYEDVEEELETSPLSSPRYEYDDILFEHNIDSCSIYESSINNFKSDKEEYEFYENVGENKNTQTTDKYSHDGEFSKTKSRTILERNINSDNERINRTSTRNRRNSKSAYTNDNTKSNKKKNETKTDIKYYDKNYNLSIKEIQTISQEISEKKKKSIISNNEETIQNEDADDILYNLKTYQTIKNKNSNKIENEYDDKNINSEWSWSWGRLPHLKVQNQTSNNGSIVLSSNKKKKKNRSVASNNKFSTDNNKNKEFKNEHLLSIPNNIIVRKRNFSECYVKKTNDHNSDIKKYSLACINKENINQTKEKNINFITKDSKSKNIIKDAFTTANKNNNIDKKKNNSIKSVQNNNSINTIQNNTPNNLEIQRNSQSKSTRPLSANYNTKRNGEKRESNLNPYSKGLAKKPTESPNKITESTKNMFESKVIKKKDRKMSQNNREKTQSNDYGAISDSYIDEEVKSNYGNNYYDQSIDDTQENGFDDDIQNRIECSLCGHLLLNQNIDNEHNEYNIEIHNKNIFEANIVTYDQIDRNSNLWYHPSLVFRFDKKDPYYPSRVALPLLASWVVFNQPLSIIAVEKLLNSSLNLIEMKDKSWRNWFGVSNVENNNQLKGKNSKTQKQNISNNNLTHKKKNISNSENNTNSIALEKNTTHVTSPFQFQNNNHENNRKNKNSGLNIIPNPHNTINLRNSSISHNSNFLSFNKSNIKRSVQESIYSKNDGSKRSVRHKDDKTKIRYRKSLRPTSEQLQSLNLKEGANTITFLVTSSLQGTKSINGTIYLWKKNAKIVISDVDGTITRSNVLGHIMPIVGKDWSHDGVFQLFNKINNNGYHILYLTARAIGQADSTREYLFRFKRNDNKLPDGPLILSPDRLFPSFKREVIDKKPYIFKIAALRDIRNLFPLNHNPFYAAFGNTESDHRAYISVGVPEAKVFIIDNHGIVHHVNSTYAKTYETMSEITEYMFPSIKCDTKREDDDQYNSFQYWKMNSLTYYEKYMDASDSS